jgi:hypothetical protein
MHSRMRPREKHTLTFEEHLENVRAAEETEEKEAEIKRKKLEGFERVKIGTFRLDHNKRKSVPTGFSAPLNMAKVFMRLATPEFVDKLVAVHLSSETLNRLPKKLSMGVEEARRCVYRYFCQRLYITADPAHCLRANFKQLKAVFGPRTLNYSTFDKLLVHLPIVFVTADILDHNYRAAMSLGRVITIDEKLKGFQGDSPHKRYVPNKDPSWGHWITEAQIKGDFSGLPYLIGQYPLLESGANRCVDIFQWSRTLIAHDPAPVTLTDPYYLDAKSLTLLESRGDSYLCGVNCTRFREVWEQCQPYVKKIGDSVAFWNFKTNQLAVMFWDPHFGKKYVLTNAFTWVMEERPLDLLPVREAYKFYFNTCDRFNQYLHDKWWPYRRQHWQSSYDDFYFSALLMNTYVLWHELTKQKERMDWKTFAKQLAVSLWAEITTHEPHKKK